MKIGIDARLYGKEGRGIGRYLKNFIKELEQLDKENEYFIFLYKTNFPEYQPQNKNFKKIKLNIRWYTLKEQIFLPIILRKYKLDLIFFPHFNIPLFISKKYFLTIHDLLLHRFPDSRATTLPKFIYHLKILGYRYIFQKAVENADVIFVPSNFTKKELLYFYPNLKQEKIEVTYLGIENFGVIKKEDSLKHGYFLYIGAFYPHKNIEFLIDSFLEYRKKGGKYLLFLIGRIDWFGKRLVEKYKQENSVRFLGYVDDKKIGVYYKNAKAFIFPSIYEGFGLPPLEALNLGCKVFASDIEVLREVLKDKAYFFNPYKKEELINLMFNVDNLPFPENIDDFLKKFTWKTPALKFLHQISSKLGFDFGS